MKLPGTLTLLGFITKIRYEADSGVIEFHWPKKGRSTMALMCDGKGRRLFGFHLYNRKPVKPTISSRAFDECAIKYTQWSGYDIDTVENVKIKEHPMFNAGRMIEIDYVSDKWDDSWHEYFHTFDYVSTVHLDNEDDPELICISGKRLRITEDGVEG
jgi:hypothetical protein